MGRRVGFYRSWMDLRLGDLGKKDLDAFNTGMTTQKKASWTLGLSFLAGFIFVFMDALAAGLVLAVGVWVIWNRNNRITKLEKKIFLTAMVLAFFFALADKVSIFLNAAGLFAIVVVLAIVVIWRR